ncbi:MAG: ABC transporter permease [Thermoanaerobaculia bacterium]
MNNTFVVLKKEYLHIVKSLAFWLSTVFLPILMLALMVLPVLLVSKQKTENTIYIKDESNCILRYIEEKELKREGISEVKLKILDGKNLSLDELKNKVENKEVDGVLIIPENPFNAKEAKFYARNLSNFSLISKVELILNNAITKKAAEDLKLGSEAMQKISHKLNLEGIKILKGKEKKEGALTSFFAVFVLFFILYTAILGYGAHILRAVLEEKNTRVVEILVSSISPFKLMIGKILGVALAGITQILIWAFAFLIISFGASQGLFMEKLPSLNFLQISFFGIFFVLGYLLYASLYAALGSLFSSEQEAQQMSTIIILPLILPIFIMQMIIQAPNSTLAVVLSLIPFFTPLLFYLRMLVETPPLWQIVLSILLTSGTVLFVIYLSGKIYRVGILMYGKRPNIKEIFKWIKA